MGCVPKGNKMATEAELIEQVAKLTQQVQQLMVDLEAAKKAVTTPPDTETLIATKIAEAIADIKVKLSGAYDARDAALQKVAEFEREKNEAIKAQLAAEGKHKELADLQLAEKDAKIKDLEKANTELARNNEVRSHLAGLEFRNDKAADLAFREITNELVKDDKGNWVHKSGKSITDFVKEFSTDESQSFLFKPKTNNGGGGTQHSSGAPDNTGSLFKLSTPELLKRAAEGTLRK